MLAGRAVKVVWVTAGLLLGTKSVEAASPASGGSDAAAVDATISQPAASAAELSLLSEVEGLDRRLSQAEHGVAVAEANRRQAEATLANAQAAKATATLRYQRSSLALARRLGAAMRGAAGAQWTLLGGSASISDFVDRQRVLDAVARYDQRLWRQVQQAKQTLEGATQFADETRNQLLAAETARRGQRDALAQRRRQRSDRLRSLRRSREARLALQREQAEAGVALRQVVQEQAAPPGPRRAFADQRGSLPWPAEGRVKKAYGQRIELTFGTATAHNGLDIAAPAGAPVQAVAAGKVVYADWLRGFGQVVIVEHSGGYHAVFAHLAAMHVGRGQWVAPRQRLGVVGDTGSLRGTVLYFEIRHRGVPLDPQPWLAAAG